ncbi:unnamed protein product, partial [Ectocarpus sp. 8 AP-2014]
GGVQRGRRGRRWKRQHGGLEGVAVARWRDGGGRAAGSYCSENGERHRREPGRCDQSHRMDALHSRAGRGNRQAHAIDTMIRNVGYDGGLLKVFRRYDDDHSGSITATEMTMMVRDSVSEAIAEAPDNCSLRLDMEPVVETLVKDVARDLVAVMDVTGSGMLGWTEFKKNQTLVTARLATLREFVFSVALRRGGTAAATADAPPELASSNGSTRLDSL